MNNKDTPLKGKFQGFRISPPGTRDKGQILYDSNRPLLTVCHFLQFQLPLVNHGPKILWKIPEINNSQVLNCTWFAIMRKSPTVPLNPTWEGEWALCPAYPCCTSICYPPVSHLVALSVIRSIIRHFERDRIHITLTIVNCIASILLIVIVNLLLCLIL